MYVSSSTSLGMNWTVSFGPVALFSSGDAFIARNQLVSEGPFAIQPVVIPALNLL